MNPILDLREKRDQLEKKLMQTWKQTLLVIKANYPGIKKESPAANWVVFQFCEIIDRSFTVLFRTQQYTGEGLIAFRIIAQNPQQVKTAAIDMEEKHPLGRLIDIDIHHEGRLLSRSELGLPARKCFLCGNPAVVCGRSQAHEKKDLQFFFTSTVEQSLFLPTFPLTIAQITAYALFNELCREFGYGCVTANICGNHNDMTYETFLISIRSIIASLSRLTEHDLSDFATLRRFGITMEKSMFESTDGVNTHKGAIFIMLALIAGVRHSKSFSGISPAIESFCSPLQDDFEKPVLTRGMSYCKKYGITGIRSHALNGFSNIFTFWNKYQAGISVERLMPLIIASTDDTTTITRGGLPSLRSLQNNAATVSDEPDCRQLDLFCSRNNLSTGGSADILSAVFFIDIVYKYFNRLKEATF